MANSTVQPYRTPLGDPGWLATGYDDVRALLSERLLGRAHRDPATASRMSASALFGGPLSNDPDAEAAAAARRRALLTPAFSARRIATLRTRIDELVAALIDDLLAAGSPADLHAIVSFPLPVQVICELLGVPYADRAEFGRYADEAADTVDAERSQRGLGALWTYMAGLVAAKQATPADDVVSDLIAAVARDGGDVFGGDMAGTSPIDRVTMLAAALLFAGFETTVAAIDRAVVLLTTHRDQWELVCADPALVPAAVEETLRCPLPVDRRQPAGLFRYAATDLDVAGATLAEGDLVALDLAAANLDPDRFPDPDRFDVRRGPNPHLTFGHGQRFCQGAALARAELGAVVGALATRLPGIRLATEPAALQIVADRLVPGLAALPVEW